MTSRSQSRDARDWRAWLTWVAVLGVVAVALLPLRDALKDVHVALAFLLVVQFAGARSGRTVAAVMSLLAFLAFDWFFVPPYGTFRVNDPFDWFVLIAFLLTSLVSAQLMYQARAHAELASRESSRASALQDSHRAKDAVLTSVSHDLRTPLTTIKSLAHELVELGDERAVIIEEEADRLARFVTDLLDLSRITSGIPLDIQPNEAEDLLGAAAQRVSSRMSGRELRIVHDLNEAILIGRFDFAQTLRALTNLLENATKYSPPGTPIELGAHLEDGQLCFSVADRGPGIPPAELEHVFEPFYRRGGTAPDVGGAGLGLSIARGLVEAQGGTLTYSARTGGGSVFTIRVPAMTVAAL
jgi:two-component system sensor histidine kinase KdpD